MVLEDNDIIQMYFDRDETAISATSEKYGNYCNTVARNILDNDEDTEECVNDTYLKTWNSIPPNRPSVLRTYLGKITRNLAFDLYRKRDAKKRGNGNIEIVLEELEECLSGGYEPEEELDKKEFLKEMNAFLGTLPREKCAIFVKRYWYAESVTAIAHECGITETNVSVTLNRLRKKLRSYLKERGYEL